MTILIIVAAFVLLDIVAARFGADTRVGRQWAPHDPDDLVWRPPERSRPAGRWM